MDEPRLTELDLAVITITEDPEGVVAVNHEGMSAKRAVWLLESARLFVMNDYWYPETGEEDED